MITFNSKNTSSPLKKYLSSRHHLHFRLLFPLPVIINNDLMPRSKHKNELGSWVYLLYNKLDSKFKSVVVIFKSILFLFHFRSYLGLRILATSSRYGSSKSNQFQLNNCLGNYRCLLQPYLHHIRPVQNTISASRAIYFLQQIRKNYKSSILFFKIKSGHL